MHKKHSSHGGKRVGAGRPTLSKEELRIGAAFRFVPGAVITLKRLAKLAKCSQAGVLEWFLLSPEAERARAESVYQAGIFSDRQPGQVESDVSRASKKALRQAAKDKLGGKG